MTFGWPKGIWGIGIDAKKVDEAIAKKEMLELEIYSFKEKYIISPTTVRNYAIKNKTVYQAKGNTKLYVIPQTELRKIKF